MNPVYNFCWYLLKPVLQVLYPHRVRGLEHIPEEGGFVLCANHISAFDPIYIAASLPRRRQIRYLAKKELMGSKFIRRMIEYFKCIPVDRGNADLAAVRASIQTVKDGHPLGIFPQGTRSRDNTPTPFLSGAAMIALRAGAPVIPCYVDGPYRIFRRCDISFGAPIDLSDFGRRCDGETLQQVTARIEEGVWSLRTK